MAISRGHIIRANEIQQKLLENLSAIKNNLQTLDSIGSQIPFEGGPEFSDSTILDIVPAEKRSNFLANFTELSLAFENMANEFMVVPGEPIALEGMAKYALSCHTLASYLRKTTFVLMSESGKSSALHNTSFVQESPTMSAYFTPATTDPLTFDDFKANWAENHQQNLSSVDAFLSETDGIIKWSEKPYDGKILSEHIDLNDLNSESKLLHIGATCFGSTTLDLFNTLSAINYDIGSTISCLYYWVLGKSQPIPTVKIKYENTNPSDITGSTTDWEIWPLYSSYTVKSLQELGWELQNPNQVMNSWKIKNTSTIWNIGSQQRLENQADTILVPNIENENIELKFHITKKYDAMVNGTRVVTDFTITNNSPQYPITQSNGIITISNLFGYSFAEIQNLECALNEYNQTHRCEVVMVDKVSGSRTLISRYRYIPDGIQPFQTASTNPNHNYMIYSVFPRTNPSHRKLRLKVGTDGKIKFCFEVITSKITKTGAGHQWFLCPTPNVYPTGGITNLKVYVQDEQ